MTALHWITVGCLAATAFSWWRVAVRWRRIAKRWEETSMRWEMLYRNHGGPDGVFDKPYSN